MKRNASLTCAALKEILSYDPGSGEFTWIKIRSGSLGKRAGCFKKGKYRILRIARVTYLEHRLAWLYMTGKWPTLDLDHIDRNPRNNRFCNLREATNSQNLANTMKRRHNTSGFKGVGRNKIKTRWQARIRRNGKSVYLGTFDTAEEAGQVYQRALAQQHGEFAAT